MKPLIIAEIGLNHDGDFVKAIKMIYAAKQAGADIVKFQYYDAAKLLGKDSPYYEYANKSQFSKEDHEVLCAYAKLQGIEYLVSVFDVADIPWADSICKRHKVASRMNKDKKFIKAALSTRKEVIISVQHSPSFFPEGVRWMYCITEYPTPTKMLKRLPCHKRLGLSSHCPSLKPTKRALKLGASIIEHHVCISREEPGCDKSSSITFEELKELCDYAKTLER